MVLTNHEPHSGVECSNKCMIPCTHSQCTYCTLYKENEARKAMKDRANARVNARRASIVKRATTVAATDESIRPTPVERALREKQRSLLAGLPAQRPEDHQKATITRAALEGLTKKAGVRMDWNNGEPIIYDDFNVDQITKASDALGRAAGETFADILRDQLRGSELSAGARAKSEKEAIQKLYDSGASDADIEAAKSVLGWKPAEFVTNAENCTLCREGWVGRHYDMGGTHTLKSDRTTVTYYDESPLTGLDVQKLKEEIAKMKATISPLKGAIVHPSFYKGLKFPNE